MKVEKKLLIVGAGILQLPAIIKAKEMGLIVAVVDMDKNAPGISISDKFYKVSTIDVDGVVNAAVDFMPDGVMTLATDMPMRSVAAVAEKLHLPGISSTVAIKATDKIAMIRCFEEHQVPHPWFEVITSKIELQKLNTKRDVPYIMKPSDSSGSRGVVLVTDKKDAPAAFLYSKAVSKTGRVLVEEYMTGPEVSVESLTVKGKTTVLAVTDKLTTGAPFFVEMGHSQPSQLDSKIVGSIKEIAVKAIEAIGINNSPSHVEVIVTKDGPKLVELGARLGGDCITTYLVPLSTGIDMVKSCILLSLNQTCAINPLFNKGAAIRYIQSPEGIFNRIDGIDEVRDDCLIHHLEIVKRKGDLLGTIKSSGDRVGYVITQADNVTSAIEACERALNKIKIQVD